MRIANVDGRAVLLTTDTSGIDVAVASAGKFGPHLPSIYEDWDSFRAWAEEQADLARGCVHFRRDQLGSPVTRAAADRGHRAELLGARGRVRLRGTHRTAADVHQVREQPRRARLRRGAPARRPHRLGGRARRGHRPRRPGTSPRPTPGGTSPVSRSARTSPSASRSWPVPLRSSAWASRSRLRARRSVAGHAGRVRRPGRPRTGLLDQRRDRAGRPHPRPDLAGRAAGRRAVAARSRCCPATSSSPARRQASGLGRTPQRFLRPGETLVS